MKAEAAQGKAGKAEDTVNEAARKSGTWSAWLDGAAWWLWLILLVGIPVTSFPIVATYIGGDSVSPFSILPLIGLGAVWLLPWAVRERRWPRLAWPMAVLVLLALLAAAQAMWLPLWPFKSQTVITRSVRAFATLLIGLGFYLSASTLPGSDRRLRMSIVALNLGAVFMLLDASIQAQYVLQNLRNVPPALNEFHRLFSVRDLFRNRVTAFAYEPSWLGDQLVVLYLPIWIAFVLRGKSVFFRPLLGFLSLELVLAIWGSAVLLLAQSRISVLSLLAMTGLIIVAFLWGRAGDFADYLARSTALVKRARTARVPLRFASLLIALALLGYAAFWLVKIGSNYDKRMNRLLRTRTQIASIQASHPYDFWFALADRVAFAERLVYWDDAYRVFERYPLLGVGLGNSGFLFPQTTPGYGYSLTEIRNVLSPANPDLPNPKNLWVRLLAETGIAGLASYLTWMVLLFLGAWVIMKHGSELSKILATAGLLTLGVQLIEGFSLDSFALPQVWVMNGLLTAVIWRNARDKSDKASGLRMDKGAPLSKDGPSNSSMQSA